MTGDEEIPVATAILHHRSHHKQARIAHGEQAAEVDVAIVPLVLELWKTGFVTVQSCQRHSGTGKVWIQFLTAHQAENFLNIVAPYEEDPRSIYRRVRHWYFGMYEPVAGSLADLPAEERVKASWEFHLTAHDVAFDDEGRPVAPPPYFSLQVSVLFPRSDVRTVLSRLRQYNLRLVERLDEAE